jgi:glutathione S-transferase
MLELYHWEPNAQFLKPLIALAEKQASFVSRWFDPLQLEQYGPGFPRNLESELNLEGDGPVLVHDGAIISGSFFMLEYIAEALPGPSLLAQSAYARYQARAWSQFLGASIGPALSALGCARYLAPLLRERKVDIARVTLCERRALWQSVIDGGSVEHNFAGVKRVEAALQQSPWLAGPAYSIADIDAFALIDPLPELAPEVVNEHETPCVMEFLHRMRGRAAVQEALGKSRSGSPREAFVPGAERSRWG